MTDEQRAAAIESLKRDLESAPKLEALAKYYLEQGVDAAYVANKYGVRLEGCQRYAAALAARRR